MNLSKIFNDVYDIDKNLSNAINSILVIDNKRKSYIPESYDKETNKKYKNILTKYFDVKNIDNFLFVTNKVGGVNYYDAKNDKDLGEMLSYPCSGEHLDFKNRKYVYTIYVINKGESMDEIKYKNENVLMAVICINKNDKIFKKLVDDFQQSTDKINKNLEITYEKTHIPSIASIIEKTKNKKKLKDYEMKSVLGAFLTYRMPLIVDFYENKKYQIFKKKKFMLVLLNYVKYSLFQNADNIVFNKIMAFQKNIIEIYFDYKYSDEELNKIGTEYLGEDYKFEDDIDM
jgi:hypothetical protein